MATTLTTKLEIEHRFVHQNALDNSNTKDNGNKTYELDFANGTDDNQTDIHWHDRRFVTPATVNDDLDLAGGLTDAFGNVLTFKKVKKIVIENLGIGASVAGPFTPTQGEDLLVGGAGAAGNAIGTIFNANQDAELTLTSGGILVVTSPLLGWTVTTGTGDVLRIVNDGTDTIWFDIFIEGTSVAPV